MKLRRLLIRNYRGIKTLDWRLNGNLIFLAGAGDSTKTTILDALTLVLSSRYNVTVTDVDFYQCDTSSAIAVQAVITDLPESLLRDDRQGWNLCGIRTDGQLEHEPLDEADVQPCLIVE
ncbi:MAG: AAA family ATPase, partial [Solirubrobacteraceae bacterium]